MNNEAQTTTEQLLSDARAARGATVGGRPKYNPFATWTEAPWLPATPPDSPEHNQGLHGLLVRFAEEARKMFFDETEPVEFRRALAGVMNALGRLPDYRDMPRAYGWVLVGRFHPGRTRRADLQRGEPSLCPTSAISSRKDLAGVTQKMAAGDQAVRLGAFRP